MAGVDPDVTRHLQFLDVDDEIFALGIDLVENGLQEDSKYALPYQKYPGASYLFLELVTPDRSTDPPKKGTLRLLEHRMMKNYIPPGLSEDIVSYTRMEYMKKDINLHPRHIEYAQMSKRGELNNARILMCAVIFPNRGVITFDMN